MAADAEQKVQSPDPAAICACVLSLWHAAHECERMDPRLNLSESYSGMDSFMREIMRIGMLFENWSCEHISFDELTDVWPYLLEDTFGEACLKHYYLGGLTEFDETSCLRIALHLRLPLVPNDRLRIPVDERVPRPTENLGFREFRIQSVRDSIDGAITEPYRLEDDPEDEAFGTPYFGLYGIDENGLVEHIGDRRTYSEAAKLAQRLGVEFPASPSIYTAADR